MIPARLLWLCLLPSVSVSVSVPVPVPAAAREVCPPVGFDAASLQALKQRQFVIEDAAARQALALGLSACLSSADPALRDGIAYEALAQWMRGDQLDIATRRELRERLERMLEEPDAEGFRRPFAALVLSEIARTDRIGPWMSVQERGEMVAAAADYLRSVRDYRGYDEGQGWRHGVAHGSDWLMQLALNPALERDQLDTMLDAIASQAVPAAGHAYVFGEPGRLARPVLYIAKRGLLEDADWRRWFLGLPERVGDRGKAYADRAWLARQHDLLAFLTSLYLEADQSDDPRIRALKAPLVQALKAVP